jgi:hypothetical protein
MKFKNFLMKQNDDEEESKKGQSNQKSGQIRGRAGHIRGMSGIKGSPGPRSTGTVPRSTGPVKVAGGLAKSMGTKGHNFKISKPQVVSLNTSLTGEEDDVEKHKHLHERFFNSFHAALTKKGGGYTEIFENPKSIEIKDIMMSSKSKTVNFLVDFERNSVYCWKDSTDHFSVVHEFLGENGIDINSKNAVWGVATLINNKLSVSGETEGEIKSRKLDWLTKWFDDNSIDLFEKKIKK